MPKHPLTPRFRRPKDTRGVSSPLLRQWKLLEQLSSNPEGATVYEAADRLGVDAKTIRRDLVLFKRLGFDVGATKSDFGLKYWRIQPRFETLRSKRQQYRSIRDSLVVLIKQAQTVGDQRLAADLQKVRRKVEKKGR
jgi:predicted DNA-binding transcriptional regulator YafY